MLNTPPTFAWYFAGLVFKWLKRQGGLAAMARAQSRQGRAALPDHRRFRLLSQPGRAGLPLVDECAVHAGGPRARGALPRRGRGRRTDAISRATARWAACARASTTPCRSRGSRRCRHSCRNSHAATAETAMRYRILTLNNISARGLERLPRERYEVARPILTDRMPSWCAPPTCTRCSIARSRARGRPRRRRRQQHSGGRAQPARHSGVQRARAPMPMR